jgi:hypothetical protein
MLPINGDRQYRECALIAAFNLNAPEERLRQLKFLWVTIPASRISSKSVTPAKI